MIDILLKHGASIFVRNQEDEGPTDVAVKKGIYEVLLSSKPRIQEMVR